ncbi:MAG TPA: peptide ABC transporter substrate-binding protein [Candidatus Limnocylindria bacterium]|nr:peptide ABC transporter substrate-binding protein [Candidatus Limnocylindria bacterium]
MIRSLPARLTAPAAVALLVALLSVAACAGPPPAANGPTDVRISSAEPFTWDPARAGDAGTASVLAQVFEGLTAFDPTGGVQPALAQTWSVSDDGRQITFQLRPGLMYSDGTALRAQDVVDSWLALLNPARPSPLASLLADVTGAADYISGSVGRDAVGLRAIGDATLEVDLARPATYFIAVTASPSLGVVPPSEIGQIDQSPPDVVSGAYVPEVSGAGLIHLSGNANYWAGLPALDEIDLVTDFGGQNGTDMFTSGQLDYVGVSGIDVPWVKYDRDLGPQLRSTNGLTINYYGFTTTIAPFDDPEVRLAFAEAVDWQRMVTLGGGVPATSMIPENISGRDDVDHQPQFNPDGARARLAAAGYPGGQGLPPITLTTYGVGYEATVAAELEANLGVKVTIEALDFNGYSDQVENANKPQIWTLSWIADYPHPQDFLGLLLQTGSTSNTGHWSNPHYDALLAQAGATADVDEQARIYGQAQEILAQEAPVVPVYYDRSFALSRTGLLGAVESGVGFIRYAGLAWDPSTGR